MASESITDNDFIVYVLRRPDKEDPHDRTQSAPFYVGKGRANRPSLHLWESRATQKNTRKLNIIRAVERNGGAIVIEIAATGISEAIAFIVERQLIAFYGRDDQGGSLANRTDGGEGTTGLGIDARQRIGDSKRGKARSAETIIKLRKAKEGFRHSESACLKIGNINRGKTFSPEHRARISAAQAGEKGHWFGKKLSLEHRQNIATGNRGKKQPEAGAKRSGEHSTSARPVLIDGQRYVTVAAAAQALGICTQTLYRRLRRGNPSCAYIPGTEAIGAKHGGIESPSARAIRVNGVEYGCVSEAIEALGIGNTTFYRRVRKGEYEIEYLDI